MQHTRWARWILTGVALAALGTWSLAASAAAVSPGDRLATDGNYAAAAQAFAKAAAAAPQDATILGKLARARLMQGEHNQQAVTAAEKAVQLAPREARYQLLLGEAYSRYVNDVSLFRKLGIAHKIRDAFRTATELAPDNAMAHFSLAMYYLAAPGVAGGDKELGQAEVSRVAQLDPALAKRLHANLAFNAGHKTEALQWLLKAAAEPGADGSAALVLARWYATNKQAPQALATYQQVTRQHPEQAVAWYQIGRLAALGTGDPKAGIAALTKYLGQTIDWEQQDPPYCWAHYRLGQLYVLTHDEAKARSAFQQALTLNPDFAEAHAALGELGGA